jgi:hypothetical protein
MRDCMSLIQMQGEFSAAGGRRSRLWSKRSRLPLPRLVSRAKMRCTFGVWPRRLKINPKRLHNAGGRSGQVRSPVQIAQSSQSVHRLFVWMWFVDHHFWTWGSATGCHPLTRLNRAKISRLGRTGTLAPPLLSNVASIHLTRQRAPIT